MLNGKELIERAIITGKIPQENIAQHGIDLNLIRVERLVDRGFIPLQGKTVLPKYQDVRTEPRYNESIKENVEVWSLQPGIYSITFAQGCKIPADQMLLIRQRSSLLRCGASIMSAVFDAGFETDNIGCTVNVVWPIDIEYGARVAQIYNHICTPVENLYNGQWQNDKQRK